MCVYQCVQGTSKAFWFTDELRIPERSGRGHWARSEYRIARFILHSYGSTWSEESWYIMIADSRGSPHQYSDLAHSRPKKRIPTNRKVQNYRNEFFPNWNGPRVTFIVRMLKIYFATRSSLFFILSKTLHRISHVPKFNKAKIWD